MAWYSAVTGPVSRTIKKSSRQFARTLKSPGDIAKNIATGGLYGLHKSDVGKTLASAAKMIPGPVGTVAKLGETAMTAADTISRGKVPDMGKLVGGLADAGVAMYVPGGTSTLRAVTGTGTALLSGRRLEKAIQSGAIKVASGYVPESVVLGAIKSGTAIVRGRPLDKALISGALTAGRSYIPGGARGQQAYSAARAIASGTPVHKAVSRAAKSELNHVLGAKLTSVGLGGQQKAMRMGKRNMRRALARGNLSGIPAMVVKAGVEKGDALATAGRLIASMQSADPTLASYAKAVMNATAKRARKGDPAARRAVSFLKTAQSANKSEGRLTGFMVTSGGRVIIGSFIQTG